jgi:acyl-coenzyme A thioesterase PaaI-like protein
VTLWQRLNARLGARRLLRLMRFWPPYLGAGVRVTAIDPDLRWLEVAMDLNAWNRNYVGTHFGGSLYAMCDPFYMFLAIENLGPEFVVWDKAATIDFIKPGRGRVTARFQLDDARLAEIRAEVEAQGKSHPRFEVLVRDAGGDLVARVGKVLSVKKKGLGPPMKSSGEHST